MVNIIIIVVIMGVLIGSFLNVCICRIPRNESISYPPSHCYNCNQNLKPIDLVPIISYICLRGKCRYCGAKISIQYPVIEVLMGVIFVLFYLRYGINIFFLKYIVVASCMVLISVIDYRFQIIPDKLNLFLFVFAIIINLFIKLNWMNLFLGFIVGGGAFWFLAIVSRGGMGGGDIKLMASIGMLFGFQDVILIEFLSFVIGGVLSLLLIGSKIKSRTDFIAFGPFIAISVVISMYIGDEIIHWYFKNIIT